MIYKRGTRARNMAVTGLKVLLVKIILVLLFHLVDGLAKDDVKDVICTVRNDGLCDMMTRELDLIEKSNNFSTKNQEMEILNKYLSSFLRREIKTRQLNRVFGESHFVDHLLQFFKISHVTGVGSTEKGSA